MKVTGVAAGCLLFSALTETSPILVSVPGCISSIFSGGMVRRRLLALVGSAIILQLAVFRASPIRRWSRWS